MTRTGQAATDYAMSRVGHGPPPPAGMSEAGMCLQYVRQNFDIAPLYASAIDAWNACASPHPGDRNPPAHVPAWFLSPSIYDHVAHHAGGGAYVTTFNDDVRFYPGPNGIDAICRDFDASWLGWGEDINGVRVYVPHTPPQPPIPGDLMAEKRACLHNIQANTWVFLDLDAYTTQTLDPDRARLMAGVHDVEIQDWNAGDITYLLDAITAQRRVNQA